MAKLVKYTELAATTELEQQVARDIQRALGKRGAKVTHHGTPKGHAPSSAPADITIDWGTGKSASRLLVEVAQRKNESEFTSITEHLNRQVQATRAKNAVNVLYSGISTSVRLTKFIRNENKRREDNNESGRIIFIRLNDLQELLVQWASYPADQYPVEVILTAVSKWQEFTSDLAAYAVLQSVVLPGWSKRQKELDKERQKGVAIRQERLRKDIVRLENQVRERGITGNAAHNTLIYLFFAALYEDKRGADSRMTKDGFDKYKSTLGIKTQQSDRTVHELLTKQISEDKEIEASGLMKQYKMIDLPDSFVIGQVLPIFESYPLFEGDMDFIGAVFEALARRAEKDNRIGQFFTPETAVEAVCALANPGPADLVLDPACGTGRFLIHSMQRMIARADEVSGKTRAQVEKTIQSELLLGTDLDEWVAAIAKMNMYLHGDGKSTIKHGDGLALATCPTFAPAKPKTVSGLIDIVLTNPPLGDINFKSVGYRLAQSGYLGDLHEPVSTQAYKDEVEKLVAEWTRKYLSVVPHKCNEESDRDRMEAQVKKWELEVRAAVVNGDDKAEKKARKFRDQAQVKLADVHRRIGAKEVTYSAAGNTAKGGALFLSAILDYLKPVRDPQQPEEWKGGLVGIVIDEAVLNTSAYSSTRTFIRDNFFTKAIVSLPREAFQFLARTTAKTSILLLAKKPDPAVIQREPVFYAEAKVIGYTSTGPSPQNDLPSITSAFDNWRSEVRQCYRDGILDGKALSQLSSKLNRRESTMFVHHLPEEAGGRVDYAYRRMLDIVKSFSQAIPLCELLDPAVRIPEARELQEYAYVSSSDGRVRSRGEQDLKYKSKDLREICKGDILLSGIDVVKGAIGVVGPDCHELVVSKEFFTLIVKEHPSVSVLPEYIVCLLRSKLMRDVIQGRVTGVSNRTRIENIDLFLELPIPYPPSLKEQRKIAAKLWDAYAAQDQAEAALTVIEESVFKQSATGWRG